MFTYTSPKLFDAPGEASAGTVWINKRYPNNNMLKQGTDLENKVIAFNGYAVI
jgi:hypothetical protein